MGFLRDPGIAVDDRAPVHGCGPLELSHGRFDFQALVVGYPSCNAGLHVNGTRINANRLKVPSATPAPSG